MPIDNPKPPDKILEEFCTLTGMAADGINHKPCGPNDGSGSTRSRGRPKGVKNRPKVIKVQSPGSASAGAGVILMRLRNSKLPGKGRSHYESSPLVGGGKRSNSSNSPINDALSKVLDRIAVDREISRHMVFREGSNDSNAFGCKVSKDNSDCLISGNDGSFINTPLEVSKVEVANNDNGMELKGEAGDGCVDPCFVSNSASKLNVAGAEHMEVENTRKSNKDGEEVGSGDSGFVFGNAQSNKCILNKPIVGLTRVQFGPSLFFQSNVWSASKSGFKADGSLNIESFAEKMKKGVEDRELQMNFTPQCVSLNSDGAKRIAISVEDIKKVSEACALQLYGYFVGTSMDYRVVNANLSKMWRVHGVSDITKTSSELFYFKFKSEEGMKAVLESGPWMVNNIPLVLDVWEPGIWLEKVEPSTIPIWVCVYGIPMELCNGNGIGKIFSGIGKPMLMDKMTKERCLKKSGKLDFASVLVEISAEDPLPNSLEMEYPQIGHRPATIGKLDVKYEWKPPQCTHCKTFGHSTSSCKVRPRTEAEIEAKNKIEALKIISSGDDKGNMEVGGEDGFVTVGKKNKVVSSANAQQGNGSKGNDQVKSFQTKGVHVMNRPVFGNFRHSGARMGSNQQNKNGSFKQQSNLKNKGVGVIPGGLK
ncbi:hypothetical protein CTI12_AA326130 [Artemisia annua]|uniref:DUF4283 domain-containing protein n=1 Tax=Artemisia annua TaxID=35608 RepID=A0A2U1MZ90_ARTAN|nr:hypothetical protein CTI12_AA326130 [Artemisia annua]